MAVEMPMHLIQLEALPSALDILRYLYQLPSHTADMDDICAHLGISERRFNKAIRRLVTIGYLQMKSDYNYELVRKGMNVAEELAEYDRNAPADSRLKAGKINRLVMVALPRQVTAQESTTVFFGFPPSEGFNVPADVIVRFEAFHAQLSTSDEMLKLGDDAVSQTFTLTPELFDQVRLKVRVFQLSEDGSDLTDCGGMFVDVDVVLKDADSRLVAYSTPLAFNAF